MRKYSQESAVPYGVPGYLPAGPILGALLGAALAREGERVRGGIYGGLTGAAAGLGAYAGQSAGSLLGGTVADAESLLRGGNPTMLPGTALLASGAQGLGAAGGGMAAGLATLHALRKRDDPWSDKYAQVKDLISNAWRYRKPIVTAVRGAVAPIKSVASKSWPYIGKLMNYGNTAYGAKATRDSIGSFVDAAGAGNQDAAKAYAWSGLANAATLPFSVSALAPEARYLTSALNRYRNAKTIAAPATEAVGDTLNRYATRAATQAVSAPAARAVAPVASKAVNIGPLPATTTTMADVAKAIQSRAVIRPKSLQVGINPKVLRRMPTTSVSDVKRVLDSAQPAVTKAPLISDRAKQILTLGGSAGLYGAAGRQKEYGDYLTSPESQAQIDAVDNARVPSGLTPESEAYVKSLMQRKAGQ